MIGIAVARSLAAVGFLLCALLPQGGDEPNSARSDPEQPEFAFSADRYVGALAFSGDGSLLGVNVGSTVVVLELPSGVRQAEVRPDERPASIAFTPDNNLRTCTRSGLIQTWELITGRELARIRPELPADLAQLSADGRGAMLFSDGRIQTIDARTGEPVSRSDPLPELVAQSVARFEYRVVASYGGESVAVVPPFPFRSPLFIWRADGGPEVQTLRVATVLSRDTAWSRDGNRLALSGFSIDPDRAAGPGFTMDDGVASSIEVYDTATGQLLSTAWAGPLAAFDPVAFAPDGALVFAGHDAGTLTWWDIDTGDLVGAMRAHEGRIDTLVLSPDGSRLATVGGQSGREVSVWFIERLAGE